MTQQSIKDNLDESKVAELWAWIDSIDWSEAEFYGLQSELATLYNVERQAIQRKLKRKKNLRVAIDLRSLWQNRLNAVEKVMA